MREAISSLPRRTSLAETGSELDWHAQDNAVVIRLLAPRARFSLRIDLSLLARAETIAGFALGMPINRYTTAAGWTAMRLGPDEWLLSGPESEAAQMPLRPGVPIPPGVVPLESLKPMPVDYTTLAGLLEKLSKGYLKEWVDRQS